MKTNNRLLWLDYVAILIIVIAFFVISYCGFFTWDDIYMNYGVSTLSDVVEHTKMFYVTYGGRIFSVASQYLFSGVLGNNRIWFAIVNTMFFVLLIMTCGKLIDNGKKPYFHYVLMFALLFWFLCPMPSETLFLTAASTTYLWANTLSFVFLLFFQKYKNYNFKVVGKLGLFFMSIIAATEFITCASICGAFVIYYAFHIKEFKRNVVPFVVGFAVGSMVLLFAPSNFVRAGKSMILDRMLILLHNPIQEIIKYKALWLFLAIFVWGWIKNKVMVKTWVKNNSVLLLSLGWSVIAFSMVFMTPKRALFFPETLSLVLFLRFLFTNYQILGIKFLDEIMSKNRFIVRSVAITLLFVIFIVDAVFAIVETKKHSDNNDVLMNKLVDSGGIVALDRMIPSHRMAYNTSIAPWSREPLAEKYGLDSVHVYPFFCQDKFYKQRSPSENIFIDEVNIEDDFDVFGKYVRLIVRIKSEELQAPDSHVVFTIDYTRPRKWYKSWLDNWRNYHYDRTVVVERDAPDVCFNSYCYYVIWLDRQNAKNLKSVRYEFK